MLYSDVHILVLIVLFCICGFRHQVTMAVLELRENGDLTKLETKWWIKKGECGPPKGQGKASCVLIIIDMHGVVGH